MEGVEASATRCCWAAGLRGVHGPSVVIVYEVVRWCYLLRGLLCSRRLLWAPCSRLLSSGPPWGFVVSRHKPACSCDVT